MRFKSLFRSLLVCMALFAISAQAQTVAIAHVVYDGDSLYYADGENIKYKVPTQERNGTYTIKFTEERLKPSAIEERRLRFGLECTEGKNDCKTLLYTSEESLPTLKSLFPDYVYQEEDQPVYEIWLKLTKDGIEVLPGIPEEYIVPDPVTRVVRILPPWNNTTVQMTVNGKDHDMIPIRETYCGWFETSLDIVPKDAYVQFKQTIGDTYIGSEGISHAPIPVENEIKMDSILQIADTVWIFAKYGYPDLLDSFPGELGDCPVKNLPVMMFDWLHGAGDDKENIADQAGTTSQDFGTGGCTGESNAYKARLGMVEKELGANGVPVRATDFPTECKYTDHLDYWFLPEKVATVNGKTYTNVTCRDLELTLDDEGFWLGQRNIDSPEKGLFLLDDFQFLDSAKTVPNPYFDNIKTDLGTHNYGFTMKIQAQFEYVKGQYFEFYGDDDVWVFINNKLVVDIGGQHHQVSGKVKLDTLGLTEGETYPFHIFYAERHQKESNFKMRTSIDLKTDASMLLVDLIKDNPNMIQKDVYQKVRERELACDFSSSPETERTELGPSNFQLFGKGVDKKGVLLKDLDYPYYGGIYVTENFTRITIDREALSTNLLNPLPPGSYYIRVTLQSNPDEYRDIPFTIDPHALPNIAFANNVKDSNYISLGYTVEDTLHFSQYWEPLGAEDNRNLDSKVLPINLDVNEKIWAGRSYPINVMYAEDWANMYSGMEVTIKSSDTLLIACDSLGNPIKSVVLTQGRASFFVRGLDEVVNATLTISAEASDNKSISWVNINMAIPPVPQIRVANIYDRDGDGRTDSIWISFNKPLGGKSILDSAKFTFGKAFDDPYDAVYNEGDTVAYILAPGRGNGFGSDIFTGGATSEYTGKLNIWYTYTEDDGKVSYFPVDGPLNDMAGPVIVSAVVEYMKDGNTKLDLGFSEGLSGAQASVDLFRFHSWGNGYQDSVVKQASDIGTSPENAWTLIFPKGMEGELIPAVGDSVRIRPVSQMGLALDLKGVAPHENNPWVRITGEQKVSVTSPSLITLDISSPAYDSAKVIIQSPEGTVSKLVVSETPLTVDQVAAIYGTQGHYLGDLDMAKLVENEIAEIIKEVQSTQTYTNSETGKTATTREILDEVFSGKMSINDAKDKYGISDVVVEACNNNLLNKDNVQHYSTGSKQDVQAILKAVADEIKLEYRTFYYNTLGQYVNRGSGTITCNDKIFGETGNCLDSDGRLFLAWNMKASNNRLAGTGVYIARLELKITANNKVIIDRTRDFLWGVRRGQINAIDLGL